ASFRPCAVRSYPPEDPEIVVSDSLPPLPSSHADSGQRRFGTVEWLIVGTSSLGFTFAIFHLLILPPIVGPTLEELLGVQRGSATYNNWVGLLFFVPAIVGGLFGLLGGYMTDRFGRRRVLVWTVILYQTSACLAAFSTNVWTLLILRCTT